MQKVHPNMTARWFTLLAVILNIAFNATYVKLFHLPPINEVSEKYQDLFTPAGYVFSIWGLIYLSFIVYSIAQLLPAARKLAIYDQLALPLTISNILGSAWIAMFTSGQIAGSVIILCVTLVLSIIMFMKVGKLVELEVVSRWLWVPFSLFCGWISVAVIANISVFLKSLGWDGGEMGPEFWTIVMVIVAGILAIVVDTRNNNYLYAVVIVWASVGIWDERQLDYPAIGLVALISTMLIVLFIMSHAIIRYLRFEMPHEGRRHEYQKDLK